MLSILICILYFSGLYFIFYEITKLAAFSVFVYFPGTRLAQLGAHSCCTPSHWLLGPMPRWQPARQLDPRAGFNGRRTSARVDYRTPATHDGSDAGHAWRLYSSTRRARKRATIKRRRGCLVVTETANGNGGTMARQRSTHGDRAEDVES